MDPSSFGISGLSHCGATLFIVLEMKRQRVSMYHPDFSLLTERFYLYEEKEGTLFLSTSEPPDSVNYPNVDAELINLGFGAAVDIVLEWRFDMAAFVKMISKYDVYRKTEIRDEGAFLKITNAGRHLSSTGHVVRNQLRAELNYVLPVQSQSSPQRITIPAVYLDLYLHYFYYSLHLRGNDPPNNLVQFDIEEPPCLTLNIAYRDIGRNVNELRIDLRPQILWFGKEEFGERKRLMAGFFKTERRTN